MQGLRPMTELADLSQSESISADEAVCRDRLEANRPKTSAIIAKI